MALKLVSRVSLFFLLALAVVLLVCSAGFYAFVRSGLIQEYEHDVRSTFNSLVAAIEVEPEDVSWQPLEHTIALGTSQGPDEVQWIIIGDGNRVVEKSQNVDSALLALATTLAAKGGDKTVIDEMNADGEFLLLHEHLAATAPNRTNRDLDEFDTIDVVVARSLVPLNAELNRLLVLVCSLPVAIWLLAAAVGHWFCRRALQPVLEMSKQARSMTVIDSDTRLPVSKAGDELTELALAFNTLLDHQHRAFEQQRRFTGNAAHELRTPITVLRGHIDVALRRLRSPEEYVDTLQILQSQTTQLQTIVESLLFLARAEGDAVLPDSEVICLNCWLPELMNQWKEHPRWKDIHLEMESGERTDIHASPALLSRLLNNLIENALKYSSSGEKVTVRVRHNDAEVHLEVEDQGAGIPPEERDNIFKPFFRSRSARESGIAGTGLGLAIASRIASAFRGSIDYVSPGTRGSRFTVRLPRVMESTM